MALLSATAYSRLMGWFYNPSLVQALRALVDSEPGIPLLDVACGAGDLRSLASPCWYVGVDIEADRVKRASLFGQTNGVIGDGTALPFRDAAFERVLASGFLHHISDVQAEASLDEMARVLRPNGRIVLLDAIWPRRWFNAVGWLGRWLDDGAFVRRDREYLDMFERLFVIETLSYPTSLGLECILVRLRRKA